MKVLHVIPSLAKEKGGPTQITLEMIKALRNSGIEAEIVTTNDNGSGLLDVPLYQRVEYEQTPVWFVPRFFLPCKEFIFSWALTRWLWKNLANYDLVHTHYLFSYASTCGAAIARWQKIPYIVTPYGMLTPWALNHQRSKKQVYSFIERYNFRGAIAAHCATIDESENVRNFQVPTPTFVAPYGVNLPQVYPNARQELRQKYQIPASVPIITFFSRLHAKKRPDLLIQALKQVVNSQKNFHLLLAGSGTLEYEQYLQQLVHKYGLEDQITFVGFITGKEKDILLQGADIFVLPSFSENFGIAVAEAMAAQLPVIITPGVQIAPDVASAQAGFVIPGEMEPLVRAICQLIENPILRERMGENGQKLVENRYSWHAIATQLSQVYLETASK